MSVFLYQAGYAKSDKSSCKACKQKIDKDSLRIASKTQGAYDDKQTNWYDVECFFKNNFPSSVYVIESFNKLTHADQTYIKSKIGSSSGIVMPTSGRGTKRDNSDSAVLSNYSIEYSRNNRASCKHCDMKVCKGEVRVSKIGRHNTRGDIPMWHHVKCFAEKKNEYLFFAGGESIPGFESLSEEDQQMVKYEIKASNVDELQIKKMKTEPKDQPEIDLLEQIENQSKLFHEYKSVLREIQIQGLHELLKENAQATPRGEDACLNALADCMAFGALAPCPECKGQLKLETFCYKCTGNISEWTKCGYATEKPKRYAMIVPKQYECMEAFQKFEPKVGIRVFEKPAETLVVVKKEEPNGDEKPQSVAPLKNLQFFLYGKLKSSEEEIKKRILKMGGLVVSKLTDTLAAVVSTKLVFEKMSSKMQEIQQNGLEVVEETFLDLIDPASGTISNTLQLIKEHNIANWGSDPAKRVPKDVIDGKSIEKIGSMYKKSKAPVVRMKIKGRTAVDPESGLQNEAHVFRDDGVVYTAVLSKTDVTADKNSFYKIQVLQSDTEQKFWLFSSYGRVGTDYCSKNVKGYNTSDEAIEKFKVLYFKHTRNQWEKRDEFEKKPNAYYPIETDYGDGLAAGETCDLAVPIQNLIRKIFDIENMTRTLFEYNFDTEKMPLGKLSKKQIMSGYSLLSELQGYLTEEKVSASKINDATSRFYTLIPHSFGTNSPPLLNNMEAIETKTEMLDNLMKMEFAYSIYMKTADMDEVRRIETHYKELKTQIEVVDQNSEEFKMITEYTKSTQGPTHTAYRLEVQEVFKVVREGEHERYEKFKNLHNRRLLWHGSRLTNFAGILSQGLRIAPPEAPSTGYMFGKGIYFADIVSKSANYCKTDEMNPVGLLLLSEVALGDMKECHAAFKRKLSDAHSVWGVGRRQPRDGRALPDGALVPLGPPVPHPVVSVLEYNEFIVYDLAQVNIKYLIQMKFNYN